MKGKPVTTCEAAMPDCQTEMSLPVPSEVLPPPVLSGSCSSIEPVPAQCDLKQNWRMWVSCVHLFSKATNTTRSLLQVFPKLLLQGSLCYLQVNRRRKLSQISSWRSCTHQTSSHWISLLLDTRPAFSASSSALNRLTLSSAWTKWKRNLLQWFVHRLPGQCAS